VYDYVDAVVPMAMPNVCASHKTNSAHLQRVAFMAITPFLPCARRG